MSAETLFGAGLPRLEALGKANGSARYTDDLSLPGMLHGAVLGSPHPHARILSCDPEAARKLPGVKAVITGADIPLRRFGLMVSDETALAIDRVRFIGEPVAAVAAVDLDTARAALELIRVEYEPLPTLATVEDAVAEGAPLIHEHYASYPKNFPAVHAGNTMSIARLAAGDAQRAFATCDVVVEGTYDTPGQHHAYMEPVAALAEVDAVGRVTVWSSTQSVFRTQICVSEALGLPRAKVRSVAPFVGGGFGGKSEPGVQLIAALLARAAKRPVKVVLSRSEDISTMRSRHPGRIRLRTGALRDGTIIARQGEVLMDGGAYADDSPAAMMMAVYFLRGPYRIPNVSFDGRVVYTNKLRSGAFRGVGAGQANFASESQIDEVALQLGIDPIDLRMSNALRPGDSWLGGHAIGSASLSECLERVREASGWNAKRRAVTVDRQPGPRRGIGVSSVAYTCAYLSTGAVLRLLDDGTVTVATGAVDIGQGSDTAIAQMCASALRLPLGAVNVVQADTDAAPYNSGTNASRVTYMLGKVIAEATDELRAELFRHAADLLECDMSDLELGTDGRVGIKGSDRVVTFAEISRRAHFKSGGPPIARASYVFHAGEIDPTQAEADGMMSLDLIGTYVFGAQVVEVEVDEVTGRTRVLEGWSAHDVGRAVNRQAVEGQIQGGFVMGLGYALQEELVVKDGRVETDSFGSYKIPAPADVPARIHPIIIENPEPSHPLGVKGIGEPPLLGVAPAVANAVENATGVRVRSLPITGERVLSGLLASDPDQATLRSS